MAIANSDDPENYNVPRMWVSTNDRRIQKALEIEIKVSQSQELGKLSIGTIAHLINNDSPFGVAYHGTVLNADGIPEEKGHFVLGVGYAIAEGHDPLVISNDPSGGVQRVQTYEEFKNYNMGDDQLTWDVRVW